MNVLVQFEIRQAIPVGVHFHHAIVQPPHLCDFGIGCVFAGKPTGQSFEIPEHHEAVVNILGAEIAARLRRARARVRAGLRSRGT